MNELVCRSNVPLHDIFNWLVTNTANQDIENILKDESRQSFPFLLSTFIREQSSAILKWHNVGPIEPKCTPSTPNRRENVLMTNLSPILTPTCKLKSPVETRNIRKITPQRIDLQSEASFPPLSPSPQAGSKDITKKRRINPTQLLESSGGGTNTSPKFSSSPRFISFPPNGTKNPFNQAKEQSDHKNLDQERALLKERKQQAVSQQAVPDLGNNLPKTWPCLEPDPTCVTRAAELDRLSALFAFCISNHLIPLVYSEVKFLIELLLLRVCPARMDNDETLRPYLLGTVHNCVYFAATTMGKLDSLWLNVDRCLVQLLAGNPRLVAFSSDLADTLNRLAAANDEKKRQPYRTVANVAFQTDTDNRLNFASDVSFQTFRKQRDLFCEVWQIWKANNSSPGWSMAVALQKMILSLVDMRRDCVNYAHLARLFRSQLLNVAQLIEAEEAEPGGPLGQLQSSDPDKLRRLRDRLMNPTESRAHHHLTFEGDQEFFRDFIVLAGSPAFNEHLKNSLASGIEEFSAEDCDDQVQFAETVVALQVMAKFLAFLTFHPYTSGDRLPENVFHHMSRLRASSNGQSTLELLRHVDDAFRGGRLVLAVPWLVVYLSLADPVSICLPGIHRVVSYLVYVYRRAEFSPSNGFFVRLLLSWFFDQPHFPRPLLGQPDDELLPSGELLTLLRNCQRPAEPTSPARRLDHSSPLVDSTLMYQCCPCLWTWKQLLMDFAFSDARSHGDRSVAGRKITPISAEGGESPSKGLNSSVTKTPTKSLQLSLQENFFQNQPSSVRRTVDFVAERLASNIVRDVRHQLIPRAALEAQAAIRSWPTDEDDTKHQQRIDELSRRLCDQVRRDAMARTGSQSDLLDSTVTALLPNDVLPAVRQVCSAVAAHEIREKVTDWINLHVTVGFFKSDLMAEWTKLDKGLSHQKAPLPSGQPVLELPAVHDGTTLSPSTLVEQLKKAIREVIRDASTVTEEDVKAMLERSEGTLRCRKDVTPAVFKCLQQLTFDFVFIVCVFQPECVGSDSVIAWVEFWKRTFPDTTSPAVPVGSDDHVEGIAPGSISSPWLVFAPKQLLLLAQSVSPRRSWGHVSVLVLHLLKTGLVSYKAIQEQAVAVLRQEWPQELLERFATCVRDIVDWQQAQKRRDSASDDDGDDGTGDGLLSWLSWFCAQGDL